MKSDFRVTVKKLEIEAGLLHQIYLLSEKRGVTVSDVINVAADFFLKRYDPILLEGLPRTGRDEDAA